MPLEEGAGNRTIEYLYINQEVRTSICMCAALAFLHPEQVQDGWILIHSQAVQNEKLTKFFDYFVDQWLENPNIQIEMWNCHQRRHRTNNVVEGWNHRLNSMVGKPHPRLRDLITYLKKEAESSDAKMLHMELNLEGVKRKKKYITMDSRIERATETLEKTKDMERFLRNVLYFIQME